MSLIELTKELVSIASHSGETAEIEDYLAEYIGKTTDPEFIEVPGIGRCVLGRAINDPDLPTILLNGHLDTVAVCEGWKHDPFAAEIEDGTMYGLGCADMKGGVAVGLAVFREAAKSANVIYCGTIDEEGDSAGAFAVLDKGIEADLCLTQEPSNLDVMLGCRGRYVIDVEVTGRSAHGATPELGVNAVTEAAKLVARLEELPILSHEILGSGSLCVLDMRGGTETLSVPEKCNVKLDRHVVPEDTSEAVISDIRQLAGSLNSPAIFEVGLNKERPTPFLKPYLTSSTPLVERFLEIAGAKKVYGRSVGDYNAFAKAMPTVVYGPTGNNWHSADEWLDVASLDECFDVHMRFFETLRDSSQDAGL